MRASSAATASADDPPPVSNSAFSQAASASCMRCAASSMAFRFAVSQIDGVTESGTDRAFRKVSNSPSATVAAAQARDMGKTQPASN